MHMTIRVIVSAKNAKEALATAKRRLDNLVGEGRDFDYYRTFDEKDAYGYPAVTEATSEAGMTMIREGMAFTRQEFLEAMAQIRGAMFYTDEEIMNERRTSNLKRGSLDDLGMIRLAFHKVGQYTGSYIWLYDGDGQGIRNQYDLDNVLTNYGRPLEKGDKLYVIPADMHF